MLKLIGKKNISLKLKKVPYLDLGLIKCSYLLDFVNQVHFSLKGVPGFNPFLAIHYNCLLLSNLLVARISNNMDVRCNIF